MINSELWQRFGRFLVIGTLGFVVDAATFQGAWKLGLPLVAARAIAFGAAMFFTFVLNRSYTYGQQDGPFFEQFIKYFIASGVGSAINLSSFFSVVYLFSAAKQTPLIALVIGSMAGLVANFLLYTVYVFKANLWEGPAEESSRQESEFSS